MPFPHKCGASVHSCLEVWNGASVPGCKPWMSRRRMNHDSMKRDSMGFQDSGILCLNLRGIKVFADKFPLSRKTPTRASDVLMREKLEIWQAMCTCVAMRSCIVRHLN